MKTITLQNGTEATFSIYHSSKKCTGYGHYKLTVEIEYNGDYKEFSAVTTDMEFIDSLTNESNIDELVYDHIEHRIDEQIAEWIYFLQN